MKIIQPLLVLLLVIPAFIGYSQIDTTDVQLTESLEGSYFAYLYNKDVVEGSDVFYANPIFKAAFIQVDEKRYNVRSVKFYQNEEGFFANTNGLTYSSNFAYRIETGSINLYELVRESYNPGVYNGGMWMGGGSSTRIDNFYNIGFGNLKKATYDNLKYDLRDKPEALLHLDKYKSKQHLTYGLYAGAAVMVIGSFALFSNQAANTNPSVNGFNSAPFIGLSLGGAALGWIAYYVGLDKYRHIRDAIGAYNGY